VGIFDYPEICHDIVAFLSRQDLIACLRVSHTFHQAFSLYVWESVTIVRPFDLGLQEWASLPRRTHHDLYNFYKDNDYNPEDPCDMPKGPSMASLESTATLSSAFAFTTTRKGFSCPQKKYYYSLMDRDKPERSLCGLTQETICAAILAFAQRSRPSKSASLKAVAGTAHTLAGVDRPGSDTRTKEPSCGRKTVLWLD